MKAVLRRLKDGEETFTPINETLEALEDFQFVVKTFKQAHSEQLIESVTFQPHNISRGIDGMVNAVIVPGGLTIKGEEYLSIEQPDPVVSWLTTQTVIAIGSVIVTVVGFIILDLLGV